MKIFISWSGERSKLIANALQTCLNGIFPKILVTWMSKEIPIGSRWGRELSNQLQETNYCITCLTKENIDAPWILFEAGAIAKAIDNAYVCPYLFSIEQNEIERDHPLTQFQCTNADRNGTWVLIKNINKLAGECIIEQSLQTAFDVWWNKLEKEFENIAKLPPPISKKSLLEIKIESLEKTNTDLVNMFAHVGF